MSQKHKLPQKWADFIIATVKSMTQAKRNPTVFMVSKALIDEGLAKTTAREYVHNAIRDGYIKKHGFTLILSGE